MSEDYCRCPGCGTCAASKNEKKLKMKLRRLEANEAALLEALKEISDDYADRFDLDSPSTNPGIKYTIKQARALITRIEAERNAK